MLVGVTGLEPVTPACKAGALPAELNSHLWCLVSESNQRHGDFQSPALPTELTRLKVQTGHSLQTTGLMATQKGLEPSTSSVTGWHSNQLNYCANLALISECLNILSKRIIIVKLFCKQSKNNCI